MEWVATSNYFISGMTVATIIWDTDNLRKITPIIKTRREIYDLLAYNLSYNIKKVKESYCTSESNKNWEPFLV